MRFGGQNGRKDRRILLILSFLWRGCNATAPFCVIWGEDCDLMALGGCVILGQTLVIVWGNGCVSSWKGGLDIAFVGFSYMFAELSGELDIIRPVRFVAPSSLWCFVGRMVILRVLIATKCSLCAF